MNGNLSFGTGKRFAVCLAVAVMEALAVSAVRLLYGFGEAGGLPECGLYEKFKLYCPACGITRSVLALAAGDIKTALRMNLFCPLFFSVLLLAPFLPGYLPWKYCKWLIAAALAMFCIYGFSRNFSWFPAEMLPL